MAMDNDEMLQFFSNRPYVDAELLSTFDYHVELHSLSMFTCLPAMTSTSFATFRRFTRSHLPKLNHIAHWYDAHKDFTLIIPTALMKLLTPYH
jgi:hypothetical protein